MPHAFVFLLYVCALLFAPQTYAESQHVFMSLGQLQISQNNSYLQDDKQLQADIDELPLINAGVQSLLWGEYFRLGFEGGALLSWQNKSIQYSGTSGGNGTAIKVRVDNNFWLFGTFLGALADINLHEKFRLYAAGGPMLVIGSLAMDQPRPQPLNSGNDFNFDGSSDTDASLGWYYSAGVVVAPSPRFEIGFSVKQQYLDLDFNQALVDLEGQQYMLSLGYKL